MTDDFGVSRPPSDYGSGSDYGRDLSDELPPAYRDAPPDILSPIDASAPVSGHVPPRGPSSAPSLSPENDWTVAAQNLFPILRPVGTLGVRLDEVDRAQLVEEATKAHTTPLLSEGPCGLAVAYALPASGFDILVNGEHIVSWGVEPEAVRDAALANLAAWSSGAGWTDEASGDRRLLSSDSGTGLDAARILLPAVRAFLTQELGAGGGRVLIGLPDRHLLMAGSLRPGDEEFAVLFRNYVVEHSEDADEPIDRRIFELVGADLVEFKG